MSLKERTLLGIRVPMRLKKKLAYYCASHGIKINFFVSAAIVEKLEEVAEEKLDLQIAGERLNKPDFVSEKELNQYLSKRRIKH